MCWHPDNINLYVVGNKGIIKINTITKETDAIFPYCQSNVTTHISISNDGKYLLASVAKLGKKDGIIKHQRLIRLIDLNTKAQHDLELP